MKSLDMSGQLDEMLRLKLLPELIAAEKASEQDERFDLKIGEPASAAVDGSAVEEQGEVASPSGHPGRAAVLTDGSKTKIQSRGFSESGQIDIDPESKDSSALNLEFLLPSTTAGLLGRLQQFEILRVIGQGGTGIVLEGFGTPLLRSVAIKALAPRSYADALARQRFCREARAMASLDQRLAREGRLPVAEVLRIGMQVASSLTAAPSNFGRSLRNGSARQSGRTPGRFWECRSVATASGWRRGRTMRRSGFSIFPPMRNWRLCQRTLQFGGWRFPMRVTICRSAAAPDRSRFGTRNLDNGRSRPSVIPEQLPERRSPSTTAPSRARVLTRPRVCGMRKREASSSHRKGTAVASTALPFPRMAHEL